VQRFHQFVALIAVLYCLCPVFAQVAVHDADDEQTNHVANGQTAFLARNFPLAISEFSSAIEDDPRNAVAYQGRGRAKAASDDFRGGLADLTRAIELDRKIADSLFLRGNLYESRSWPVPDAEFPDAEELALADYDSALKIKPDNATFLVSRGALLLHQGLRDHGTDDFSKALEVQATAAERTSIFSTLTHRVRARLHHCTADWIKRYQADGAIPDDDELNGAMPQFQEVLVLSQQVALHSKRLRLEPTARVEQTYPLVADVVSQFANVAAICGKAEGSLSREATCKRACNYASAVAFTTLEGDCSDSLIALSVAMKHIGKISGDRHYGVIADYLEVGLNETVDENVAKQKWLWRQAQAELIELKIIQAEKAVANLPKVLDPYDDRALHLYLKLKVQMQLVSTATLAAILQLDPETLQSANARLGQQFDLLKLKTVAQLGD